MSKSNNTFRVQVTNEETGELLFNEAAGVVFAVAGRGLSDAKCCELCDVPVLEYLTQLCSLLCFANSLRLKLDDRERKMLKRLTKLMSRHCTVSHRGKN